jgi:O-antigen/teichoic acid export membrane protein
MRQYGLLVLLLSVFGTINMLNVGVGTAIVDYYSKYGKDKSIFWSIFIVSFLAILFISIFILSISSLFYQSIFNALGVEKEQLNLMAFYGFSLIGISRLLSSITSSYWVATVDFLKLKLFGFINIYFSITMILIFYWAGLTFNDSLFFAGILNFFIICLVTLKVIISSVTIQNLHIISDTKKHFKEFITNGFQFQGLSIINNVSNPIINVLINTHFGLQAVSLFDIVLKLLRSGRQIIVSATEPFFGKMTQLHNQDKRLLMRLLVLKYTKYMMIIAILYIAVTVILSKYILTIWMGANITQETYKIANIVSIGFGINIVTAIIYNKYLAIRTFRKYVLYHQLLLLLFSTLPFLLEINTLEKYSIYYSVAFTVSSIYLLGIFYKNQRIIH